MAAIRGHFKYSACTIRRANEAAANFAKKTLFSKANRVALAPAAIKDRGLSKEVFLSLHQLKPS